MLLLRKRATTVPIADQLSPNSSLEKKQIAQATTSFRSRGTKNLLPTVMRSLHSMAKPFLL